MYNVKITHYTIPVHLYVSARQCVYCRLLIVNVSLVNVSVVDCPVCLPCHVLFVVTCLLSMFLFVNVSL